MFAIPPTLAGKLVEYLAEIEHTNLIDEYNIRNRLERRVYPTKTVQEKMDKLDKISQELEVSASQVTKAVQAHKRTQNNT